MEEVGNLSLSKGGHLQLRSARSLTLRYTIPVHKTAKFWEALREGKIVTTRCKRCGRIYFPPTADCTRCMGDEMDWIELSGEAELEAFTEIHIKPASFRNYPNYICAVGKLKEGPRALAWLVGVERGDIKVGMKLHLRPKVAEDDGGLTYEYTPG